LTKIVPEPGGIGNIFTIGSLSENTVEAFRGKKEECQRLPYGLVRNAAGPIIRHGRMQEVFLE
jgi:hypothetical protein